MLLKLTRHVQDMIQYRDIDIDHIKKAMREPDTKEVAYKGSIKVRKQIGEKMIEVIYSDPEFRTEKNTYLIRTAYYL